ncbi:5941_t:CDS:2 [Rhizophagus irregularis]|nr:5941_t:CDS:2 [Rhizophagus irregularis]
MMISPSPPMALKQCNFKQAIDVIDKNFRNSLDKQKAKKKALPQQRQTIDESCTGEGVDYICAVF